MNVDLTRIFEFTSSDGIQWKRADKPAVEASGESRSCIYPSVIRGKRPLLHVVRLPSAGWDLRGIFCATSPDGSNWTVDHERAAFPASRKKDRFDGRLHVDSLRVEFSRPLHDVLRSPQLAKYVRLTRRQ